MAYFPDGPNCCSSLSWPQCNKGIFRWFDALGLIRQSKGREIRSSGFVFLLHTRRARLSHVARMALTVAVVVGFTILPYSTASVGAALACVIALFTISVYKPDKKKAKAKPEKAKVGKTNNA